MTVVARPPAPPAAGASPFLETVSHDAVMPAPGESEVSEERQRPVKRARVERTQGIIGAVAGAPASDPSLLLSRRTPSFDANMSALRSDFPNVHEGVITSLLETAGNCVVDASCLIQQLVDESNQPPNTRLAKRRDRSWCNSGGTISLNAAPRHSPGRTQTHARPAPASIAALPLPPTTSSGNHESSRGPKDLSHSCPSTLQRIDGQARGEAPPACDRDVDRSSVTSAAATADKVKLLSRCVIRQFEKLNCAAAEAAQLRAENAAQQEKILHLQGELQSARHKAECLEFFIRSNNYSQFGGAGPGPPGNGGGAGFDSFLPPPPPGVF